MEDAMDAAMCPYSKCYGCDYIGKTEEFVQADEHHNTRCPECDGEDVFYYWRIMCIKCYADHDFMKIFGDPEVGEDIMLDENPAIYLQSREVLAKIRGCTNVLRPYARWPDDGTCGNKQFTLYNGPITAS